MPGNELGDGVHNFFVQDHPLQGQQQSQVAEGNWPVLNSSFPAGAGGGEYPFFLTHGSPLTQSGVRPTEQSIMNGFVYGNHSHQTMQNAANSDQRHNSSAGFSFHELQQRGPDTNAPVPSETSVSPVSFDFFGGQRQMSHQQSNMPHFLQPRQSVINDPQQLQQQLMIRKFQEIQRQQLDSRQDYSINQAPSLAKHSSGSQSTLVNGTSNSNNFQNPLSSEYDANRLHQVSPRMQASFNGLPFQLNTGQTQSSVNLMPQQFDQSLYGFPVSNSRGLPETQYPQMMADSYLMPQPQITIASSSSPHGNQNNLIDHVGIPDESSVFRHKFHSQNDVEVSLKQSVNTGVKSSIAHQQVNNMSRNVVPRAFGGKQELNFHSETSCAKSTGQVSSPMNEVALDPEEEKILFGSDDNIWSAFGNVPHISGEPGKMIGNGGLFDGLPSTQSGSWSALMQSAVAETSGNDAIVQAQSSKFFRSNEDGLSARQMSSVHDDIAEKANSSSDNNVRMQSRLSSGSFAADKVEVANSTVFNQSGNMIQHEPGHGVHIEAPYSSVQPLKEAGFRFFSNPLKTSGASQHHKQPQRDTKRMMSEHSGTGIHSSWNNVAAMPPDIDRLSDRDAQNSKQSSQNIQDSLMLGQISSSWERNSLLGHKEESVRLNSDGFNLGSKGLDDASVANLNGTKRSFNTSPLVQSNSLFNQWKSAVSPATSLEAKSSDSLLKQTKKHNQISDSMTKGDEYGSAKHEAGKSNRDNTCDSHFSNLSHYMSHGVRERGSTITNDPRFPTSAKQKPANQFHNKGSASRKFLYHPMGNVDEDVETGHKLQPSVPFSTVADGSATLGKGENSLHKMPGSISSGLISGIHSSKSHLHDKKSSKPGMEKSINLFNDPFNGNSSLNTQRRPIEARLPDVSSSDQQNNLAVSDIPEQIGRNDFRGEIPSATVPMKDHEGTSQHFVMPGTIQQRDSAKMLFNIWSNAPMHHNSGQGQLLPSQIPNSPYHNILESSSTPMQHLEECKSKESISQHSDSVGTDHVPKTEESLGKESSVKNFMNNSPTKATSVLKEIEDFGRYLRPNNLSDQTYPLPNQTQVLKDKSGDSEITDRTNNIADGTPASLKARNQGSNKTVMSPDSKMMSSSEPVEIVPSITSQCGISQNDSGLNPSVSQSNTYVHSATIPAVERRQVNVQMAPTWFSAHGSSKSGQMMQIYNAHKLSQVRPGELPLPTGKSTIGSNALNLEEKCPDGTPGASVVNGHYSSSLPQLNVTGQNIVPLRLKKRKNATFGPQPWHKEISDDSRFLGILSMAEPDSSKAANRGDGVAQTTEDANSVLRSKRRLIMSSHLMQQLIRPPPPVIPLSGDASTSYEVVAYSVSRIALGDACHAVSYANSLERACSSMNLPLEMDESPMKTSGQAYEKAAQELIGKITKLENDLSRQEKSASLLDLRVECQELEKFATINRFARFHGRPKNDGSETAASANATVGAQKFLTQRYVNAVAMPRNLPETVNCLQL